MVLSHADPKLPDPECPQLFCHAGGFIVDDDGAGYMDIGEEDDWGAEAENEDALNDSQPTKKQKAGDSKNGGCSNAHPKSHGKQMTWVL